MLPGSATCHTYLLHAALNRGSKWFSSPIHLCLLTRLKQQSRESVGSQSSVCLYVYAPLAIIRFSCGRKHCVEMVVLSNQKCRGRKLNINIIRISLFILSNSWQANYSISRLKSFRYHLFCEECPLWSTGSLFVCSDYQKYVLFGEPLAPVSSRGH
jgi:hypothetical protein